MHVKKARLAQLVDRKAFLNLVVMVRAPRCAFQKLFIFLLDLFLQFFFAFLEMFIAWENAENFSAHMGTCTSLLMKFLHVT